jgi:hypothetical protein
MDVTLGAYLMTLAKAKAKCHKLSLCLNYVPRLKSIYKHITIVNDDRK